MPVCPACGEENPERARFKARTAWRTILAEALGRTEEAATRYAEAAAAWDEWGSVPERAYARSA